MKWLKVKVIPVKSDALQCMHSAGTSYWIGTHSQAKGCCLLDSCHGSSHLDLWSIVRSQGLFTIFWLSSDFSVLSLIHKKADNCLSLDWCYWIYSKKAGIKAKPRKFTNRLYTVVCRSGTGVFLELEIYLGLQEWQLTQRNQGSVGF